MIIVLISSNPLFREIIYQATSDCSESKPIEVDPALAPSVICKHKPEVIIIDETIDPLHLEQALAAARELPRTRTILLNPKQNDIVLFDSRRATIRKVDDLMEAIMTKNNGHNHTSEDREIPATAATARIWGGIYGFLAALFNQRPDADLVKRLRSIGVDAFISLTGGDEISEDVSQGLNEMAHFVEKTLEQPETEVEQTLAVDWTRLFRGLSPSYGPPPPYEGVYREDGKNHNEVIRSLNQIYGECGAAIGEEYADRPDYIGLELGFLSFLAEQEAEAWEQNDRELALSYQERARSFFNEHPGAWGEKFLTIAMKHARTDFYLGFLRLSLGVLSQGYGVRPVQ